jgi:2-deoxy-D-gluconate 3-dehydrogenase
MHLPHEELLKLDGKTALVTGAANGIGRAITERLHEAGANLVVVDQNAEKVHTLASELHDRRAGSGYAVVGDVSSEADVLRAVAEACAQFGAIDILVNNAGIFPSVPLASMSVDDFMRVIDVNLKGAFLYTKFVSERMKENGGGKIIMITSIDALHPSMVGLSHYDASKHGVWGFTKNAALELAQHSIWVNAIAPGGVATEGVAAMQGGSDVIDVSELQERTKAFLQTIPMQRMGEPDDIAKVALFLASDMSSYMTGAQIVVDGGALLT